MTRAGGIRDSIGVEIPVVLGINGMVYAISAPDYNQLVDQKPAARSFEKMKRNDALYIKWVLKVNIIPIRLLPVKAVRFFSMYGGAQLHRQPAVWPWRNPIW